MANIDIEASLKKLVGNPELLSLLKEHLLPILEKNKDELNIIKDRYLRELSDLITNGDSNVKKEVLAKMSEDEIAKVLEVDIANLKQDTIDQKALKKLYNGLGQGFVELLKVSLSLLL